VWTKITRPKYERAGQRYASDLTDAEWAVIEPLLPAPKPLGRPISRSFLKKGNVNTRAARPNNGNKGERRPMIEVYFPSYFKAETQVVAHLRHLDELPKTDNSPETMAEEGD
jgi:hypothetical protein